MSLAAAHAASPGTALKDLSPEVRAALQPRWGGFLAKGGVALILAVLLGVSYYPVEVNNWTFLITDAGNMAVFISDFLRSEEHTSELQSLMRISYAVFGLKQKNNQPSNIT